MEKFSIENVVIEITRRCQLQCAHCLRGDAESKDICYKHITDLLSRLDHIGSITFTGGEPSLNPSAIKHFIDKCQELGVTVENFYIATNGVSAPDDFIKVLIDLWLYCEDNEISSLDISNDGYHKDEITTNEYRKLSVFSFSHQKYADKELYYDPIGEGRSEGMSREDRKPRDDKFDVDMENRQITEGTLYLNAKGEIISGCDWSYENQTAHKICNVSELTIEKIAEYEPIRECEAANC